jgi:hypothetical protein
MVEEASLEEGATRLSRGVRRRLADRQPRHQPRRQRRMVGLIRIDRAEPLFQKRPIHRARELGQQTAEVDDLVQAGAEEVLLAAVSTLVRPHRESPDHLSRPENHACATVEVAPDFGTSGMVEGSRIAPTIGHRDGGTVLVSLYAARSRRPTRPSMAGN